ncbi:MAG TPA: hypothetical protein VEB86_06765 [Chryseosolibacter sp.]|nr:hypothetical protein [Chryseosolibacter sp.]
MRWEAYQNDTTNDLIEYMRWQDDADLEVKNSANDAFRAFCFRFQKDVVSKCRVLARSYKYLPDVGDMIAEEVFARFWKYGCKKFEVKEGKDIDKAVKYYLYRIADRKMIDYDAQQNGMGSPYTGDEEVVYEFPEFDTAAMTVAGRTELQKRQESIEKALARLTPKHKIIYLTYLTYQKEGHNLPRPLLEKLRDALDLTQNSVGVYKKEAFDAVNQFLELYG